ncbi:hypothetical protein V1478_006546 [Vespula squamosa]|uniref:Uncharacterized protein n=1 Tax=Vespula squamosa TaxID=30214 RepID=A0ABD2B847_VESSQ
MLREELKLRVTERTTEEFFEFNANFEGTACSELYENEASASPRRLRITLIPRNVFVSLNVASGSLTDGKTLIILE